MAEAQRTPIVFPPGLYTPDSDDAESRYVDMLNVRWYGDYPEKIGGNEIISDEPVVGRARTMLAWDDFSYNQWVAVGTHLKLHVYDINGNLFDITPWRVFETTINNNPFATTNGSTTVTVTDTAHGANVGDFVTFSGASAVAGITIVGEYQIETVPSVDTYTITHSAAANATTTGGGAVVKASYQEHVGLEDIVFGGGFGVGAYGTGTYGTERTGSTFVVPIRLWALDNYGQFLLALPSAGSGLFQWEVDTDTPAEVVANAPAGNWMWVTSERMVTILGVNSDNMKMAWCDQDDNTIWTAADDNTANERRLQEGSKLVAGGRLGQKVNIIWSDTAAYLHQFTGSDFVYETRLIAKYCGLLGPRAWIVVDGEAYWMSQNTFKSYRGYIDDMENVDDIKKFWFDRLTENRGYKVICSYIQLFDEIVWEACLDGETEPSFWVAYNRKKRCWYPGERRRTASCVQETINNRLLMVDEDGHVRWHELPGVVDDNGAELNWRLKSSYQEIQEGNVSLDVWGYFPDFVRQEGDIDITLYAKDVMNGEEIIESATETIAEEQGVVDFRLAGRAVAIELEGGGVGCDFRLGRAKIEWSPAGERR